MGGGSHVRGGASSSSQTVTHFASTSSYSHLLTSFRNPSIIADTFIRRQVKLSSYSDIFHPLYLYVIFQDSKVIFLSQTRNSELFWMFYTAMISRSKSKCIFYALCFLLFRKFPLDSVFSTFWGPPCSIFSFAQKINIALGHLLLKCFNLGKTLFKRNIEH